MKTGHSELIELIDSFKKGSSELSNFFRAFAQSLDKFANKYKGILTKFNNPDFINKISTGLQQYTELLSEGTRHSIVALAQHGWFISLEMPPSPVVECATLVLDGEIDKVDKIMALFYRDAADKINKILNDNFPNRSNILDDAFKAHSRGEYNLSIPIFLIQTDGICNELIGIQMFSRRNKKPETATYANQFEHDSFLSALLEPFRICLPLTASEKEIENLTIETYLNRHEIMHGVVYNYGTELNSLKTISLINFVSTVLQNAKRDT